MTRSATALASGSPHHNAVRRASQGLISVEATAPAVCCRDAWTLTGQQKTRVDGGKMMVTEDHTVLQDTMVVSGMIAMRSSALGSSTTMISWPVACAVPAVGAALQIATWSWL